MAPRRSAIPRPVPIRIRPEQRAPIMIRQPTPRTDVRTQQVRPEVREEAKGFWEKSVLPVIGKAFVNLWDETKNTYGLNLAPSLAPIVISARRLDQERTDEAFDSAADFARTVGDSVIAVADNYAWEPTKAALDGPLNYAKNLAVSGARAYSQTTKQFDDYLKSNVPVLEVVDNWRQKNIADPANDFVIRQYDSLFNSKVEKKLAAVTPEEREKYFSSNDMTVDASQPAASQLTPEERSIYIARALGETGDPLWDENPSEFTRQELQRMSDYELLNAAFNTHTNWFARRIEGIQSDFGKITAIPAAIGALDDIVEKGRKDGDYRAMGNLAVFLTKQALYVPYAVMQAQTYALSAGQAGDYKPLVRALEKEPLLTTLDAIATASGVGKAGTVALKTGGAASKVGRVARVVPGVERAGAAIAATPIGSAAAAARRLADTPREVTAVSPIAAAAERAESVGLGVRVFRAKNSLWSQLGARGKASLYASPSRAGKAYRNWRARFDTAAERALISHIGNVIGNQWSIPAAQAFRQLIEEDPLVAKRVIYDLYGADELVVGGELGRRLGLEEGADLGPAAAAAQIERTLNEQLWVRNQGTREAEFVYSDSRTGNPPGEGFVPVLTKEQALRRDLKTGEYAEITPEEFTVATENIRLLRELADAPAETVARAKEFLDQALTETAGSAGRRRLVGFRGSRAPEESLGARLAAQEEVTSREILPSLGVTPEARVASDIVSSRLGLGRVAGGRREVPAVARLQDPTVARLAASDVGTRARRVVGEELGAALEETRELGGRVSARREEIGKTRSALKKRIDANAQKIDEAKKRLAVAREKQKTLKTQKSRDKWADVAKKESADLKRLRAESKRLKQQRSSLGRREERVEKLFGSVERQEAAINKALENIDLEAESLMRDLIEEGAFPGGGRVFVPTGVAPKGAKQTERARAALAGRATARDLLDVYKGQFRGLSSVDDVARVGEDLVRNMRLPIVAFEFVSRMNDFLLRNAIVYEAGETLDDWVGKVDEIRELARLNGTESGEPPFVILKIDEKTGFLDTRAVDNINAERIEEVAGGESKRVRDLAPDTTGDTRVAELTREAFDRQITNDLINAVTQEQFDRLGLSGSRVAVIDRTLYDNLMREIEAASRAPGRLARLGRLWVKFALSTLPRTPIANVLGSGVLSGLGGGALGYRSALRMLERGDTPPELVNIGIAGATDTSYLLRVSQSSNVFLRSAQRYMEWIYSYNVIGEDLARLSVFTRTAAKALRRNPELVRQLEDDLRAAEDVTASFDDLLALVARGEFKSGRPLSREALEIRDAALAKATDFLGGRVGLTGASRRITSFIPFYQWLSHILKLYLYTMPVNYPGRAIVLNATARIAYEAQVESGLWDTFYKDAIAWGTEETPSGNVYRTGFRTNIFPFSFGDLSEPSAVPGAEFLFGSINPAFTTPLGILGVEFPGTTIRTRSGEPVSDVPITSAEGAEARLAAAERLFSPFGVAQRGIAPNTSLIFDLYRGVTGGGIPERQPAGEGAEYEVPPSGISGRGLQGILEAIGPIVGVSPVRQPIAGPVARRRLDAYQRRRMREEEEARLG